MELARRTPEAWDFVNRHAAFFTWGLNYGADDCLVPVPPAIELHAEPATGAARPVVRTSQAAGGPVHHDRQLGAALARGHLRRRDLPLEQAPRVHEGARPARRGRPCRSSSRSRATATTTGRLLEHHGWRVRPGLGFSTDLDAYRTFIQLSRGEFSVAKDQNVRLRSGWFSERSATYLAAGRPVILQDTGFGSYLPTGEGLLAFSDLDGAAGALEPVAGDYERHSRAAEEIAREYLDAERVVPR